VRLVQLLRTRVEVVEPVALESQISRDPDDDLVLATGLAGRCDAIVTGDKDLLDLVTHRGMAIVSPRGFWSFESRRAGG
jgi:predicted nucleic acid-binding protein